MARVATARRIKRDERVLSDRTRGDRTSGRLAGLAPPAPDRVAPLYHQLKESLTQQIVSRRWPAGSALPSEHALCRHFAVSRGTLRRALADLAQQGLVDRRQGRGTFVAEAKFEGNVLASYAFYRSGAIAHDRRSRVVKCERRPAPAELRRILDLAPGEGIYEIERVQSMRGVPITLATSFFPASLCPGLEKRDLGAIQLYTLLEREYGVVLLRAEELLEPVLADDYVAAQLAIRPGTPVFLVERRSRGRGDRVCELRRSYMRGDRYKYRIDLR
jgi:GntR family transcriptional regulator